MTKVHCRGSQYPHQNNKLTACRARSLLLCCLHFPFELIHAVLIYYRQQGWKAATCLNFEKVYQKICIKLISFKTSFCILGCWGRAHSSAKIHHRFLFLCFSFCYRQLLYQHWCSAIVIHHSDQHVVWCALQTAHWHSDIYCTEQCSLESPKHHLTL